MFILRYALKNPGSVLVLNLLAQEFKAYFARTGYSMTCGGKYLCAVGSIRPFSFKVNLILRGVCVIDRGNDCPLKGLLKLGHGKNCTLMWHATFFPFRYKRNVNFAVTFFRYKE